MVSLIRKKKVQAVPERNLPEPRHMSMSLTDVFMKRRSSMEFSDRTISDDDLATILWSADGINRKDGHRTTPTTWRWREIDLYVVKANGVWLWKPEEQKLDFVRDKDRRKDLCLLQPLVRQAPVHLVYVYDLSRMTGLVTDLAINILKYFDAPDVETMKENTLRRAPFLDVGVKIQAVYMACAALDINCLARMTFDEKKVHDTLCLTETQVPVCVHTLGYKPDSIFELAL